MAKITASVTVDAGWQPTDVLTLYLGTENAAGLAGSTPAGGRPVARLAVGQHAAGSVIHLIATHTAADKCATLPVGVTVTDAAGNETAVVERTADLADPPQPPGRPDAAATANPGEAVLTWLASPDV